MGAVLDGGRRLVVAIDGPSGAGKSTTARAVATRLGLRYLDTGAMYRALTWWLLHHGVDVADPTAVASRAAEAKLDIGTDPAVPAITVDGIDVAEPIRSAEVTAAVSAVSAVPSVRARMVGLQRDLIGDGDIVVEGRDIGTVVVPDAPVKVFLTAAPAIRAQRRAAESQRADWSAAGSDLARRDQLDSQRAVSPLTAAPDALRLDTTDLSVAEAVDAIVALAEQWLADPAQ